MCGARASRTGKAAGSFGLGDVDEAPGVATLIGPMSPERALQQHCLGRCCRNARCGTLGPRNLARTPFPGTITDVRRTCVALQPGHCWTLYSRRWWALLGTGGIALGCGWVAAAAITDVRRTCVAPQQGCQNAHSGSFGRGDVAEARAAATLIGQMAPERTLQQHCLGRC